MSNSPARYGRVVPSIAAFLLFACWPAAGAEGDRTIEPITIRMLGVATDEPGGQAAPLSVLRARYELDVLGAVATGSLIQEFRNDSDRDVSATSSLRGPSGFKISAPEVQVAYRSDANEKSRPTDPGLLESEAVVAAAGETVTVRADFEMRLPLKEGRFVLDLPPVVTEREPDPAGEPAIPVQKRGRARVAEPRERSTPVPLAISITVHYDEPLPYLDSPTHEIHTRYLADRTIVEPSRSEITDGRPFEFVFSLGSEDDATLLAFAGPERDGARKMVAVLTPPTSPRAESIRARELLFIIDSSSSMSAGKLDRARQGIVACLDRLTGDDLFNITAFENAYTTLSPAPVDVYAVPPREADFWLEDLEAHGGTRLLPALEATLEQPIGENRHRMIVILTDGILADEEKVLELLKADLGEGRLFVIGIGRDVRKETIQRMVEFGRGTAAFADDPESLETAVVRLFDSVAAPLAWDLELDWGGAQVDVVQPQRLPDLYGGRAVMAIARLQGDLPEEITLRGQTRDGRRTWTRSVTYLENEDAPPRMPGLRKPAGPGKPNLRKKKMINPGH